MSYSVIGVLSAEKEINTVRMMAVHMDEWKAIVFSSPVRSTRRAIVVTPVVHVCVCVYVCVPVPVTLR